MPSRVDDGKLQAFIKQNCTQLVKPFSTDEEDDQVADGTVIGTCRAPTQRIGRAFEKIQRASKNLDSVSLFAQSYSF